MKGLKDRYKEVTPEIMQRAEAELEIINSQGFVEYFLIVWDYINYARQMAFQLALAVALVREALLLMPVELLVLTHLNMT